MESENDFATRLANSAQQIATDRFDSDAQKEFREFSVKLEAEVSDWLEYLDSIQPQSLL
ncbi:MAG: hypothetical protein K9M03_02255 [Kiritimatiellales bacterium]|nr:hypothetical protein [Kiritimatiellales bacterium]